MLALRPEVMAGIEANESHSNAPIEVRPYTDRSRIEQQRPSAQGESKRRHGSRTGDDPNDPSVFLAESIHEMFDEYYSVSLSFWTRTGLREKARQAGHSLAVWTKHYARSFGKAQRDEARPRLLEHGFGSDDAVASPRERS